MWRTLFMVGYVCALSLGTKGLLHSRQWERRTVAGWRNIRGTILSAHWTRARAREARNFSEKVSNFRKVFIFGPPALGSPFDAKITRRTSRSPLGSRKKQLQLPVSFWLFLFFSCLFPYLCLAETIWLNSWLNRKRHSNVPRFSALSHREPLAWPRRFVLTIPTLNEAGQRRRRRRYRVRGKTDSTPSQLLDQTSLVFLTITRSYRSGFKRPESIIVRPVKQSLKRREKS